MSRPRNIKRLHTDVIVIGSGYGGSVVAARAAQAGLGVTVLERGAVLDDGQWSAINEGRSQLHRGTYANGPLDIHVMRGLGALTGNALGGGSRINTAVTIRPPAFIFDRHWPRDIDLAALSGCYAKVESEIRPVAGPESLPRIAMMNQLGRTLDWPVARLPLGMDWDRIRQREDNAEPTTFVAKIADWFRGIGGAKRGLDQTYLRTARAAGVTIRENASVEIIESVEGGFRVHFKSNHEDRTTESSLSARTVVLAAGTLNTVRLLFMNRDVHGTLPHISRSLGHRFFTNQDRGALLYCNHHDWSTDYAPPATSWFDLWDPHRFFIMDLGRSPVSNAILTGVMEFQVGFRETAEMTPALNPPWKSDYWLLGVMGVNESPRQLVYQGGGRMRCLHGPTDTSRDDIVKDCIQRIAQAANAPWMMVPGWLERRMPLTVHPLGGAVMADSPAHGVTDSHGQIFGHPGLFISDGSLMSTPTGVPPSMTIAALAERVALRVVESAR